MKQCPKCGEWKYQHNCHVGRFLCYGCGFVETDREIECRIAKSKGLVCVEEYNELAKKVDDLSKQIAKLLNEKESTPSPK